MKIKSSSAMLAGYEERGERNVSLINIVKLAHALKVGPAKLIEPIP